MARTAEKQRAQERKARNMAKKAVARATSVTTPQSTDTHDPSIPTVEASSATTPLATQRMLRPRKPMNFLEDSLDHEIDNPKPSVPIIPPPTIPLPAASGPTSNNVGSVLTGLLDLESPEDIHSVSTFIQDAVRVASRSNLDDPTFEAGEDSDDEIEDGAPRGRGASFTIKFDLLIPKKNCSESISLKSDITFTDFHNFIAEKLEVHPKFLTVGWQLPTDRAGTSTRSISSPSSLIDLVERVQPYFQPGFTASGKPKKAKQLVVILSNIYAEAGTHEENSIGKGKQKRGRADLSGGGASDGTKKQLDDELGAIILHLQEHWTCDEHTEDQTKPAYCWHCGADSLNQHWPIANRHFNLWAIYIKANGSDIDKKPPQVDIMGNSRPRDPVRRKRHEISGRDAPGAGLNGPVPGMPFFNAPPAYTGHPPFFGSWMPYPNPSMHVMPFQGSGSAAMFPSNQFPHQGGPPATLQAGPPPPQSTMADTSFDPDVFIDYPLLVNWLASLDAHLLHGRDKPEFQKRYASPMQSAGLSRLNDLIGPHVTSKTLAEWSGMPEALAGKVLHLASQEVRWQRMFEANKVTHIASQEQNKALE
ncbi:hypothetical protein FRB99_006572 [Tulasnella sp. 403]|nr:hypothetical protein FRB99_006572 [Tulasnella sp. 403]